MKAVVRLGSDPEVFVTRHGKIVPSVGLVGGYKKQPRRIKGSKVGLGVLEDNVTVELNTRAYAFTTRFDPSRLVCAMKDELRDFLAGLGLGYVLGSGHCFSEEELSSPQALVMGCDPDFLAHNNGAFRRALHPKDIGNCRYAAGHIHIGYDTSIIPQAPMIQLVEALAYLPVLHMDKQAGTNHNRRKFYGLAGLFRPTSYGVEWRTPSNFWMGDGGSLMEAVGKAATALIKNPTGAHAVYEDIQRTLADQNGDGWQHIASIISNEYVDQVVDVSAWKKRLGV